MTSIFASDLARYVQLDSTHLAAQPTKLEILRVLLTERATWAVGEYRARQWAARRGGPIAMLGKLVGYFTKHAVEIVTGIYLPTSAQFGPGLVIAHFGPTIINGGTVAGHDFTINPQTTIGSHNGGVPTFGDRVFVGPGARILGNVTIGDEAFIGANAVVMKDVPAGHTAAGVPAQNRPNKGQHWLKTNQF